MTIDHLDLNLLSLFDALLRTRSVTLAAQHLGVRQPAVSGALKRLRRALNDPLFVRTPGGMMPTALALELAEPVQGGLAQIRSALMNRQAFDPALSDRRYTLYMSDTAQLAFLPRLLAAVRQLSPGTRIETIQHDIRQARKMFSEGELDLALGFFLELDEGLHRSALYTVQYVCIARHDHPTIRGTCSLVQLAEAAHLAYCPAVGSHRTVDDCISAACASMGHPRRKVLTLTHGLGLAEVVTATDLVACVPDTLAELFRPRVQILKLPEEIRLPPVEISLLWHERAHRDPGGMWLRQQVKQLFQAPGG